MVVQKTLFILISGFFLCLFSTKAQKFDRITLDNGLSQSNINCIIQDQVGFIWFGTNGGLNRYDGSEFKLYLHDIYDSLSISNNIVNTIYEDDQGLLWIGTQNGLNIYDRKLDRFSILKSNPDHQNALSSNIITAIVKDTIGNYWIGTDGGGLNKYNPKTQTFTIYQNNILNPYSISSNRITALEIDKFGYVWVGTFDNGINMLEPRTGKCLRYIKNDSDDIITDNKINIIYEDNDGDLWVGTSNGLNLFLNNKSGRSLEKRDLIVKNVANNQKNSLGGNSILSIYQGASGLVWIGTENGGLSSYNKFNKYFRNYRFDPNNQDGLLSNKITALLDDHSEILWIGTNAGINKIDRQGDRFELHTREMGQNNSFSSNNIQAIYKELNGTIWLGTFDAGLNKYDPETNEYTIYKSDNIIVGGISLVEHRKILAKNNRKSKRFKLNNRFISNNRILSIHRDLNRTLWIGTGGGGLNKLDLATGEITWFLANPQHYDSLSNDVVKVIFEDSQGILWLGTEGGLNAYNGKGFKRYVYDENNPQSISSNVINSIIEDKKGNLWIGTFGGGLNKFDRKTELFTRYQIRKNNKGISSNSVYSLYLDKFENLWIGTNDGLNMLDIEKETFKHFTIHNNLPSNFIYGILGDGENNLWLSTNKGISKFDIKNEKSKNYDRLDGLQGNEFNPGAFYQTKKGEMLFGGINGFNSFYPKNIKDNTYKPDVILTDLKILGELIKIGELGSPLKYHISEMDELVLEPRDKGIQIEFVALNFTNSEKNEYAYILENFEKKWNYVGTRRFASYTNLPPGEYVFRVKASNNDNIWNDVGRSLTIIIKPPFYRTWWFYVLIFTSILLSAYLFVLIRIRNLHKTKILLRRIVEARTQQLSNEKERVERANAEITRQKSEIENQKDLLVKNNKELSDAKRQLDNANEELKAINSNLEEIVLERTEKLRSAYENLIKVNNELDLFIYRASHDLKGPIASLLGLTKVAKLDKLPENTVQYIDKMEMGAENLNRVLNKLTDIHFINKSELEHTDIPLKEFIDNIIKKINPYELKNYEFFNDIDNKIILNSDENLIKIIFGNIIENALIFKKPIKSFTHISGSITKEDIRIVFEDNGVGIPGEFHQKIFDMFYRASDLSKGSGLGLYLVKKSIEKLKGDIKIESEKGRYTRIIIYLAGAFLAKNKAAKIKKESISI